MKVNNIDDITALGLRGVIKLVATELNTYNARRLRRILRNSDIEVDPKLDRDTLLDKIIDLVTKGLAEEN